MTLLICPVRPGDENEELRYAIRSWEANLHLEDGLELWTVGHQPSWLVPDRHIPGNLTPSVETAVWQNVALASEAAAEAGYARVIFMNDDFFCMDPQVGVPVVRRNVSLAAHIDSVGPRSGQWWSRSLRLTASWLAERGFPHPESYEVHRPLPVDPLAMLRALSQWEGGFNGPIPQWRTVYGVLNKVEAHPVGDVKLSRTIDGFGSPWISTSDESWRLYRNKIRPRFQKPSRWER